MIVLTGVKKSFSKFKKERTDSFVQGFNFGKLFCTFTVCHLLFKSTFQSEENLKLYSLQHICPCSLSYCRRCTPSTDCSAEESIGIRPHFLMQRGLVLCASKHCSDSLSSCVKKMVNIFQHVHPPKHIGWLWICEVASERGMRLVWQSLYQFSILRRRNPTTMVLSGHKRHHQNLFDLENKKKLD